MKLLHRLYRKIIEFLNYLFNLIILHLEKVKLGDNYTINGRLFVRNSGEINIGNNFRANSGVNYNYLGSNLRMVTGSNGVLRIGNNVGISNSVIYCIDSITIEDGVLIGGDCKIWDTDFHSLDPKLRGTPNEIQYAKKAPIKICEKAFIGGSSIILKGVVIGKNSVVAAGSVVYSSIPDNEIWGGNPAKKIMSLRLFI